MHKLFCVLSLIVCSFFTLANVQAAEPNPVYELRIYTTHPGKMADLLTRFREHTCALFKQHGMVNVGYWLPIEQTGDDKLYYLLKHQSREAAQNSWKAFRSDPEWEKVRNASEANGAIVASVDSLFMSATDYSPAASSLTGSSHVFELRTYTTNEGRLDALDARFRTHTMKLFTKHGMTNLFYWHPTDADKNSDKTLVYLLAHNNRAAATSSWAEFQADPEWIKVRTESEKNGKILIDGGVKSVYLNATDFSAIK